MSPPMSFFKLNIDGSAGLQPGTGGIGGVFRDHTGSWQLGFSEHLHHSTPILAEILTLRKGLIIAKQHQLHPTIINTDSLLNILSNGHPLYSNIPSECRCLLRELDAATLVHVFREQNRVADQLAKEGKNASLFGASFLLLYVTPLSVQTLLQADIVGTHSTRLISNNVINPPSRVVAENSMLLSSDTVGENSTP
ncbi:hypothetical protein FXO37_05138 [Capsicum annuum]|nr:hypothetical protein FXO37_05138 [Capsicum annuum]